MDKKQIDELLDRAAAQVDLDEMVDRFIEEVGDLDVIVSLQHRLANLTRSLTYMARELRDLGQHEGDLLDMVQEMHDRALLMRKGAESAAQCAREMDAAYNEENH